ncbi:hypothetical protein B0H13DRAFT_1979889, partial [Mycena leptocephala]
MPDIAILPARLTTLIIESFLYGLLLLLFISTLYFLATQRTLAGTTHSARHHFTSLVFFGVTALFLVVTVHWSIDIYRTFLAFIHLGTVITELAFYADLSQRSEVLKEILFVVAVLLGDALVTYRLWIIWGRNRLVVVFPILALVGVAVACIDALVNLAKWNPERDGPLSQKVESMEVVGFVLSFLANLYSTGCIIFRICRVTKMKSASQSRLTWFLAILVESAALQTCAPSREIRLYICSCTSRSGL